MTTTAIAVKERPILMSAPMVRAILEGRKTQTRRVLQPEPFCCDPRPIRRDFELGMRLWVRETFKLSRGLYGFMNSQGQDGVPASEAEVFYRATFDDDNGTWKPAIHMPRWASRITLEIVSVRIERVQDISSADCFAEGIVQDRPDISKDPQIEFQRLWDSTNAKRGYGWDTNCWAWVIEFRPV